MGNGDLTFSMPEQDRTEYQFSDLDSENREDVNADAANVTLDEYDFPAFLSQLPPDSNDILGKPTQNVLSGDAKASAVAENIKDKYCCSICGNNLDKMHDSRQLQHIQRCQAMQEKTIQKLNIKLKQWEQVLDCPLCREPLQKGPYRIAHIKRCAKNGTVSAVDLLKLIKTQEQISLLRKTNNLPHTRLPKPTTASLKSNLKTKANRGLANSLHPALALFHLGYPSSAKSDVLDTSKISGYFPPDKPTYETVVQVARSKAVPPIASPPKKTVRKKRKYAEINSESLPLNTVTTTDRKCHDEQRLMWVMFPGKRLVKIQNFAELFKFCCSGRFQTGDVKAVAMRFEEWWRFAKELPPELADLNQPSRQDAVLVDSSPRVPCDSQSNSETLAEFPNRPSLEIPDIPLGQPDSRAATAEDFSKKGSQLCNNNANRSGNSAVNPVRGLSLTEGVRPVDKVAVRSDVGNSYVNVDSRELLFDSVVSNINVQSTSDHIATQSVSKLTRIQSRSVEFEFGKNLRKKSALRRSTKSIGNLLRQCADKSIVDDISDVGTDKRDSDEQDVVADDSDCMILDELNGIQKDDQLNSAEPIDELNKKQLDGGENKLRSSDLSLVVNAVIAQGVVGKIRSTSDISDGSDPTVNKIMSSNVSIGGGGNANSGKSSKTGVQTDSSGLVHPENQKQTLYPEFDAPSHPWQVQDLLSDLRSLYHQRDHSGDGRVQFANGDPDVKVHGAIVMLRCPELWNMIQLGSLPAEFRREILITLLKYLYYGDVDFCLDQVDQLTKLALTLHLTRLHGFLKSLRNQSPRKSLDNPTCANSVDTDKSTKEQHLCLTSVDEPEIVDSDVTPILNPAPNILLNLPDSPKINFQTIHDNAIDDFVTTSNIDICELAGGILGCRSRKNMDLVAEIDLTSPVETNSDRAESKMMDNINNDDYPLVSIGINQNDVIAKQSNEPEPTKTILPVQTNGPVAARETVDKYTKSGSVEDNQQSFSDYGGQYEDPRFNRSCTPLLFEDDELETTGQIPESSGLVNIKDNIKNRSNQSRPSALDRAGNNGGRIGVNYCPIGERQAVDNATSPVIGVISGSYSNKGCVRTTEEFSCSFMEPQDNIVTIADDSPCSGKQNMISKPTDTAIPSFATSSTPFAKFNVGGAESNDGQTAAVMLLGATPGFSVIKPSKRSAFRPIRRESINSSPKLTNRVPCKSSSGAVTSRTGSDSCRAQPKPTTGAPQDLTVGPIDAGPRPVFRGRNITVDDSDSIWDSIGGLEAESPLVDSQTPEMSKKPAKDTPLTLLRNQGYHIVKTANVTPLPEYSAMNTPELREALNRYGLKPLAKRKAKLALRQIYHDTHPVLSDYAGGADAVGTSGNADIPHVPPPRALAGKRRPAKRVLTKKQPVNLNCEKRLMPEPKESFLQAEDRCSGGQQKVKDCTTNSTHDVGDGQPAISAGGIRLSSRANHNVEPSGDTPLSVRLQRRLGENNQPCALIGKLKSCSGSASQSESICHQMETMGGVYRKSLSQSECRSYCQDNDLEHVPLHKRLKLSAVANVGSTCQLASTAKFAGNGIKKTNRLVDKPLERLKLGQKRPLKGDVVQHTDGNAVLSSSSDEDECLEESSVFEAQNEPKECALNSLKMKDSRSTDEILTTLFKSDNNLYTRILMYESIHLNEFLEKVKIANISSRKCGKNTLMDYLDNHCIAFTMKEKGRTIHKRRKH